MLIDACLACSRSDMLDDGACGKLGGGGMNDGGNNDDGS